MLKCNRTMLSRFKNQSTLQRDWTLFAGLTFCFSFGFAVYNGIFQKFIREVLHVSPSQLGVL